MKEKGFTLIELLAVIVILAIIALIATPIVLNIISKSKESAQLRSAEMYIKGLETSIATATLNNKKVPDKEYSILPDGNICLVEPTNNTCSDDDTLKVEMNGEKPKSGTVTVLNGKVTDIELKYSNGKTIVKDNKGNLVYKKEEEKNDQMIGGICTYVSGTPKTAGAKYSCEVKPGISYDFYVLTTPASGSETINLIMAHDINSDGTEAGTTSVTEATNPNQYNSLKWISDTDYGCEGTNCAQNDKGPVTAMNFLYNATKDWSKVPNIVVNYEDEEGYGTIVTTNNITKITMKDGTVVPVLTDQEGYTDLKARLPYFSEIGSRNPSDNQITYLYENLSSGGYWTLTSDTSIPDTDCALVAYAMGHNYPINFNYGVRPVITLNL